MENRISEWKNKYGRLFRHSRGKKVIYYRTLNAGEILSLGETLSNTDIINIARMAILSDQSDLLPGDYVTIGKDVAQQSQMLDIDDLRSAAIQNRAKVKDNFYLGVVAKLCKVFPYTPDQLLSKNLEQLLQIVAMAENILGEHIIRTGDEPMSAAGAGMQQGDGTKFNKPDVDGLMNKSTDALAEEMAKHGQTVKQFKDVKKKDSTEGLNDLQKQMRELQELD